MFNCKFHRIWLIGYLIIMSLLPHNRRFSNCYWGCNTQSIGNGRQHKNMINSDLSYRWSFPTWACHMIMTSFRAQTISLPRKRSSCGTKSRTMLNFSIHGHGHLPGVKWHKQHPNFHVLLWQGLGYRYLLWLKNSTLPFLPLDPLAGTLRMYMYVYTYTNTWFHFCNDNLDVEGTVVLCALPHELDAGSAVRHRLPLSILAWRDTCTCVGWMEVSVY